MSNWFCINKSGKSVPIYSDEEKTKKIGTLYNREAFGYFKNWGGDNVICLIKFRNSSGSLVEGFLVDPPTGTTTPCSNYPYGTDTIEGKKYITFKVRQTRNVYTIGADRDDNNIAKYKWGSVASGRRVACLTALSGDLKPEFKGINYVENSAGKWIKVEGGGGTYGLLDAGLSVASGYSSIPFYGSW